MTPAEQAEVREAEDFAWLLRAMREACKCRKDHQEVCDWCQGESAVKRLIVKCNNQAAALLERLAGYVLVPRRFIEQVAGEDWHHTLGCNSQTGEDCDCLAGDARAMLAAHTQERIP